MSNLTLTHIKNSLKNIHYELLHEKDTPSKFISTTNYQMLFVRTILLDKNSIALHTRRFIIIHDDIFEYCIEDDILLQIPSFEELYTILDSILEYYDDILSGFDDAVSVKEDKLYKKQTSSVFLNDWFRLKSDLTKIERVLIRLEQVFLHMQKCTDKLPNMMMIIEDTATQKRDASLQLTKLDTVYHYFYSLKNEKINDQIFILTLISAIFLPINLIVGFFGINTQNLFFHNNPNGTVYVVYIIIFTLVSMLLFFPLYRFIKFYIFSRLLDKFNIYHHIKKHIDENGQK